MHPPGPKSLHLADFRPVESISIVIYGEIHGAILLQKRKIDVLRPYFLAVQSLPDSLPTLSRR